MARRKNLTRNNWDEIKEKYLSGSYTYRDLAAMTGISLRTIQQRAYRERWAEDRKGIDGRGLTDGLAEAPGLKEELELLAKEPGRAVQVTGNQWQVIVNAHVAKVHEFLAKSQLFNWQEARNYVEILEKLSKVERSNLGLDQQDNRGPAALALINMDLLKDPTAVIAMATAQAPRDLPTPEDRGE